MLKESDPTVRSIDDDEGGWSFFSPTYSALIDELSEVKDSNYEQDPTLAFQNISLIFARFTTKDVGFLVRWRMNSIKQSFFKQASEDSLSMPEGEHLHSIEVASG